MRVAAVVLALAACSPPPIEPVVTVDRRGVEIADPRGVTWVEVTDPEGVPLARQRPPAPVDVLEVRVPWRGGGVHRVAVRTDGGETIVPIEVPAVLPAFEVSVEAPVGQTGHAAVDGDVVPLTLVGDRAAQVAVVVTAFAAGPVTVRIGHDETATTAGVGERVVAMARVDAATDVVIDAGGEQARIRLEPNPISLHAARAALVIADITFPADRAGSAEIARPQGRVTLPARWWTSILSTAGLGFRARDPWAPWSHQAVTVHNRGDAAVNVAVRSRVLGGGGAPDPAFTPALREGDDGTGAVTGLLRIAAGGTATAVLPVFVDDAALGSGPWVQAIDVAPLGSPDPLVAAREPLYVTRGDTVASLGLLATVVAAVAGITLVLVAGRGWLRRPTSELTTIALFGSLGFLVSAAGQLVGVGVGAVLGPFSTLVTGLVDDAFQYALLATLITLLPRPGVATLALLVRYLLAGLALGAFTPMDPLFIGAGVLWLEGALWLSGITRSGRWRDQGPIARFVRLTLAFGTASVLTAATGLVLHVVLFRLFFAAWFVALILAVPGFLYVALACVVAVPFAASLREIQR